MNRLSYRKRSIFARLTSGGKGIVLGLCALILAILVFIRLVFPGAFSILAAPLWSIGAHISTITHSSTDLTSRSSLMRARDELEAQNTALGAQNAALTAKVADLTALLGTRTSPPPAIVASVLARPPVAPYDVLIVDQGSTAGVKVGALAMGAGGTPIGIVGEVEKNTSRVTLYSARTMMTNGWVGESRIPFTIHGSGAGAFNATIAKDAGIVIGDGVFVSSGGAFPIGTITSIEQDPSTPTVELEIHPYANPFSLTWITIARD